MSRSSALATSSKFSMGIRRLTMTARASAAVIVSTAGNPSFRARKLSMIIVDGPEHSRVRKIIHGGFRPRAVERLGAELNEQAQRIAADTAAESSGDFVLQVSRELPLLAIAGLLGGQEEDRDK